MDFASSRLIVPEFTFVSASVAARLVAVSASGCGSLFSTVFTPLSFLTSTTVSREMTAYTVAPSPAEIITMHKSEMTALFVVPNNLLITFFIIMFSFLIGCCSCLTLIYRRNIRRRLEGKFF